MNKSIIINTLILFSFLIYPVSYASDNIPVSKQNNIKKYVVAFHQNIDDEALAKIKSDIERENGQGARPLHSYKSFKGFAGRVPPGQLKKLRENPNVLAIEEDAQNQVYSIEQTNDPVASWGLDRIDQQHLPLDGVYNPIGDGEGVNAYVIDSGIHLTHQDFEQRASWSYTVSSISEPEEDYRGRGTMIAGIIGGHRFGVAKRTNLHAVKVVDKEGNWSLSGLIEGIEHVVEHHQKPAVAIVTLTTSYSSILNAVTDNAIASGVNFVVAAGDRTRNACNYSPASVTEAITAGVSSIEDEIHVASNYGTCVDIHAPGLYINSAWPSSTNFANNSLSHTPASAAHVAGAAAIVLGHDSSCSVHQVKGLILSKARQGLLSPLREGAPDLLLGLDDGVIDCSAQTSDASHLVQTATSESVIIDFVQTPISKEPLYGELVFDGTNHVYTPNVGFVGVDSFSYLDESNVERVVRVEVGIVNNGGVVTTEHNSRASHIATLTDGSYVMVWSQRPNGLRESIHFQRFNAHGDPLIEPVLVGPTDSVYGDQTYPQVTKLAEGGFAIAWYESNTIYARQYDANNQAVSDKFAVTSSTSQVEKDFSITGLTNGYYVVAWIDDNPNYVRARVYRGDGSVAQWNAQLFYRGQDVVITPQKHGGFMAMMLYGNQVKVRHFNHNGDAISGEQRIDTSGTLQFDRIKQGDVVELANGGYAVVWEASNWNGLGYAIVGRVFDVDRNAITDEFQVHIDTASVLKEPRLAALSDGSFVAVWQRSSSIKARQFDSLGQPLSREFSVTNEYSNHQYEPNIALITDNQLAINYRTHENMNRVMMMSLGTDNADILQGNDDNNVLIGKGGDNTIYGYDGNDHIYDATLGYGGAGHDTFFDGHTLFGGDGNDIFYDGHTITAGDGHDIVHGGHLVDGGNGDDDFYGGTIVYGKAGQDDFIIQIGDSTLYGGDDFDVARFSGQYSDYRITDEGNGRFVITDLRADSPDGTTVITDIEVAEFTDHRELLLPKAPVIPAYQMVQIGVNGSVNLTASDRIVNSPSNGQLTFNGTDYVYTPNAGFIGVDSFTYLDESDVEREVRVEVGIVNNGGVVTTEHNSRASHIATLTDGSYVMVWSQRPNGLRESIHFQRFNAHGEPLIEPVLVGPTDSVYGDQIYPQITALSGGEFVIAWYESNTIYARQYDANNQAVGDKFAVTSSTSQAELDFSITGLTNGYFVIAWIDKNQNYVRATIYRADNSIAGGGTLFSRGQGIVVTPQKHGGFIALILDGNSVKLRHFNHNGLSIGAERRVDTSNTHMLDRVKQGDVVELANGSYAVTWEATNWNGLGYAIVGRVFDVDRNAITDEFQVHLDTASVLKEPRLAALSDGSFVAVWQRSSSIKARQFDSLGQPLSREFFVTNEYSNHQYEPNIALITDNQLAINYRTHENMNRVMMMSLGTDNADILQGNDDNNVLIGKGGDNTIYGYGGNDHIYDATLGYGGLGHDIFYDGHTLFGDDGNDIFYEGHTITAGDGHDIIHGGHLVDGGNGDDDFYGGTIVYGKAGQDDFIIQSGDSTLYGGDDFDVARFSGQYSDYRITNEGNGRFVITDLRTDSPDGTTVMTDVEVAEFTDRRELLLPEAPVIPAYQMVQIGMNGSVNLKASDRIVNPPSNGQLTFNGTDYVYTPNAGFIGVDSFTYLDESDVEREVRVEVGIVNNGGVVRTEHNSRASHIATLIDGTYVMVWSQRPNGLRESIHFQRFNAHGEPLIEPVLVGPTDSVYGDQTYPQVTKLAEGGFAIAWYESNTIYARQYDANNQAVGDKFAVTSSTSQVENDFSITGLTNGYFVIAWIDKNQNYVRSTIYRADNSIAGGGTLFSRGQGIVVTPQKHGGFIALILDGNSVKLRHFSHNGLSIGAERRVDTSNTHMLDRVKQGDVVELANGSYAMIWEATNWNGLGYAIVGRVFDVDRNAITDEFQVHLDTASVLKEPRLAALSDGSFVAVWQRSSSIKARQFDSLGQPLSREFSVTNEYFNHQYEPNIALITDNQLAINYSTHENMNRVMMMSLGTDNADILQGNDDNNVLIGKGGDNTIYGYGGADHIYDASYADGGEGIDTLFINGESTEYTLDDNLDGSFTLHGTDVDGQLDMVIFTNIEKINYRDQSISL